jgi:O-antigen ligase
MDCSAVVFNFFPDLAAWRHNTQLSSIFHLPFSIFLFSAFLLFTFHFSRMRFSLPLFLRYFALSLLVVAFILPYTLAAHTYPVPTFYSEFAALALYLLLGAVVLLIAATSTDCSVPTLLASPTVALVPFAFGVWLIVQVFVLPVREPSMNWLGAGCLLAACVAAHAGYGLARARAADDVARWIAWALIAGGLFSVFCQVMQLLDWPVQITQAFPIVLDYGVPTQRRPFGNMAQANHLATYISFAMAAALYLVQTRRLNVFLWGTLCAIYSLGLALTVSRGPWLQIAVLVGAGFWMAHALQRERQRTQNAWRAWCVPVALLVIFTVVNVLVRWANGHWHLNLADSAAERFHEAGQIAPRLALWHYGWAMFQSHPWFGVGWGEFPHYQLEFVRALGGVEIANNAHDIFIDLLAKTGIVGCALVVIGVLAWFTRVLRAPRTAVQLFGFALAGVLLMHALVEYPQQYLFFLLPLAFVFGLLEPRALRFVAPCVCTPAYAFVVFAGIAALFSIFRDYQRAEVLYDGPQADVRYRAAPSWLFRTWADYGLATMMPVNASNLPAKLAAHKRAMALLPGEIVLRRYAVLQALNGDAAGAFDTVARLKIFATELNDWPQQLASLHRLCRSHPALAAFDMQLVRLYGGNALTAHDDNNDNDDSSSNGNDD